MNLNKFDPEVQFRNWAYGAIIGYLSSAWLKTAPPEALTAVGTITGALLDYGIFSVKKLLQARRKRDQ